MRLFLLCLIFVVVPGFVLAQKQKLKRDTTTVDIRVFDSEKLVNYRKQRQFIYTDDAPQSSMWDRFWKAFWRQIDDLFSDTQAGPFLKYFFIALGVAAVVFAVIKILSMNGSAVFAGKSKSTGLRYLEELEDIHTIDFNAEIEKAINLGNYRVAVRMLYLHSLKKLNDTRLINWQIDKTNYAYVEELKDPAQKQQFNWLTTRFEYVWYGGSKIDRSNFERINQSFTEFNRKLK